MEERGDGGIPVVVVRWGGVVGVRLADESTDEGVGGVLEEMLVDVEDGVGKPLIENVLFVLSSY